MPHCFDPIAIVQSCFKQKFGIPRQGVLMPESKARIVLLPPYNQVELLRGIDAYSHLWIVFVFHAISNKRKNTTVRPPRLGGDQRIGVFASRSGFRPNPIGLSLVSLEGVIQNNRTIGVTVKGIDLLDGTPVLDIKPYLPWSDKPDKAAAGFAEHLPSQNSSVQFSAQAEEDMSTLPAAERDHLKVLITQMLQNDPRPAIDHRRFERKEYGACLYDWNIRWVAQDNIMHVTAIKSNNSKIFPNK